ncbi:GNAT family N-acetyltransferase [Lysinibacillus sphaericus]|uniref:GNAT family N-acetyltransferase n=1 Tax=Lysinibacillus sphaericus TaxID=1421 RepID=UPI00259FE7C1|nr:GNAT family N-acetyltransferase [Lysinibacillus sphaericus]MDM5350444.1 GNAT family N-acetyltransferase [Lysinibacillus sphaericus]
MSIKKVTTDADLQLAFDFRRKVFIEEQQVPEVEEFDEFDSLQAPCDHILVYYKEQPVGTGRLRVVEGYGKLERICIVEEFRKFGLGKEIIIGLEQIARDNGLTKAKLNAQSYAKGFYEKLGYKREGEEFMDCGIPHILMKKYW